MTPKPPDGFDLVASLTLVMREADEAFEQVGGGTRHHVRECLLPAMEKHGISVLPATELAAMRARVAELEQQVAASSMCSEDAKAAQRMLMGETFPEAILRLEKQVAALADALEDELKLARGWAKNSIEIHAASDAALRAAGRKT